MASDQITFLTSDSVSITTRRSVLVIGSKVFSDLLDLPVSTSSGDQEDEPVMVGETERAFRTFVEVLEGKEDLVLSELEWETLARLGDKYDSWAVRTLVKARTWELEATSGSSPLHAFTLATFLGDKKLISQTGLHALTIPNRKWMPYNAAEEWKDRLDRWEAARKAHGAVIYMDALKALLAAESAAQLGCHTPSCSSNPKSYAYAIAQAANQFNPVTGTYCLDLTLSSPRGASSCALCETELRAIAQAAKSKWKAAPGFPF